MPKKKKVTKVLAAEVCDEYKGFLTFMDYFATGEGRTIEINFCYCDTPEQAVEKHLDRFVGTRKEARDYFGVGIEVYPIESPKANEILVDVFKHSEGMQKAMIDACIEFHFKFHYNFS